MGMLVSQDELKEITGYEQPGKQSELLSKWRIDHQFPNAKGRVVVTWEQVNNPRYKTEEPNLAEVK